MGAGTEEGLKGGGGRRGSCYRRVEELRSNVIGREILEYLMGRHGQLKIGNLLRTETKHRKRKVDLIWIEEQSYLWISASSNDFSLLRLSRHHTKRLITVVKFV